jgi:hypothetical protein
VDEVKARSKVNSRVMEYLAKAGCFPNSHVPSREDELEALGYSLSGRAIDQGWLKWAQGVGEVIDTKAIVTKHGDPMCFAEVDFHSGVQSVTVFPRQYAEYKDMLVRGAVLGFVLGGDILEALFDPADLGGYAVEIPDSKADEFLSFYPSMKGRPNVRAGGYDLASVELTEGMLAFVAAEFGVERLVRLNR